jgi:hypothetical protein
MPGMRHLHHNSHTPRPLCRRITVCILATTILVSAMPAQTAGQKSNPTNNWQAVKNIQPGTNISVLAGHRLKCIFNGASDGDLTCVRVPRGPIPISPANITLARSIIVEVRIEHSAEANAATGAAIGGGIGAALGAATNGQSVTRGGGALVVGGIGALVGAFAGRDFSVLPGKIIYRR